MTPGKLVRVRRLLGFLLAGQGLLVVLGVLDHETPLPVGAALVVTGLALAAWPARAAAPSAAPARPLRVQRGLAIAVGGLAVAGILAYNWMAGNGMVAPEWAILGYGLVLLAAAPHLDRRVAGAPLGTLVAWSLPLVAAPLSLYAVNAAVRTQAGAAPLAWYIEHGLVPPMAAALALLGADASAAGDTIVLGTDRGTMFLNVGVVCAGLYAGALFLGVFALFAWEARTPPRRLAAYLAVGLFGLHVANLLRLVLLGWVGWQYGGVVMQAFHRHAGWVLFVAWSVLFWAVVLRRFEGSGRPEAR